MNSELELIFSGTPWAPQASRLCGLMLESGGARRCHEAGPTAQLQFASSTGKDRINLGAAESGRPAASRSARVACVLGAVAGELAEEGEESPEADLIRCQGRLDLAIFAEDVVELSPEQMTGLGRHYTVSARHPVESGAHLAGTRVRFVGRIDTSEGSVPDVSLEYPAALSRDRDAVEAVLSGALTALELGIRPEAIERALRSGAAAELVDEIAASEAGKQGSADA